MKKLIALVFVVQYGFAVAQNTDPQNTIAVVAGPNWFQHISDGFDGGGAYGARIGYTVGLEYTINITSNWYLKAGVRYNEFNFTVTSGPLTWPSEFSTGQYVYDPSLPHYLSSDGTIHSFQYYVGLRLLSKPRPWRMYADIESGLADFIEQEGAPKNKMRLTIGAGFGVEWHPVQRKTSFFAQPLFRYMFQSIDNGLSYGYQFLAPAIEAGARVHF